MSRDESKFLTSLKDLFSFSKILTNYSNSMKIQFQIKELILKTKTLDNDYGCANQFYPLKDT